MEGEAIVAEPLIMDQLPMPTAGLFALRVVVEEQTVKLLPAFEISGNASLITITVEVAEAQTPFETVHKKAFVPGLKAVTCDEGLLTLVTFPVPVITDQTPLPTVGLVAAKVAVTVQTDCVIPAKDEGIALLITVTADVDVGQTPFETVHKKEFVPVLNAVT